MGCVGFDGCTLNTPYCSCSRILPHCLYSWIICLKSIFRFPFSHSEILLLILFHRMCMMMIQLNSPLVMLQSLDLLFDVFPNSSCGNSFNKNMSCRKESLEAIVLSFFLTFIPILDIPVFWPILVIYFMVRNP